MMISLFKKEGEELKAKRNELNSCKIALNELNETVENAKRDLKTGVSRETVENYLKNNFITKEGADEIFNSISILEAIIEYSTPNIKTLEEKINILEKEVSYLKKQ